MEHKGFQYIIRARPGQEEWTWTIYPTGGKPRDGQVTGMRGAAVIAAMRAIDSWLHKSTHSK